MINTTDHWRHSVLIELWEQLAGNSTTDTAPILNQFCGNDKNINSMFLAAYSHPPIDDIQASAGWHHVYAWMGGLLIVFYGKSEPDSSETGPAVYMLYIDPDGVTESYG